MTSLPTYRIGIVGGGFGALVTYSILRFRGVSSQDIAVFSPDASPELSWERLASFISLRKLRSESIGHFFPTDSPGLATVEALKRRSLWPIFQSWFDRYHPAVDSFLQHARDVARQMKFQRSLIQVTIGSITRAEDCFIIKNEAGESVASAQHLVLAVGHGPANTPDVITNFRAKYSHDEKVKLSYEPKEYGARTVLVLGDGITAATEWVNVLRAGGAVAGLSRDGFAFGQPLQVPRRYFSSRGLRSFRRQAAASRYTELIAATKGTIPRFGRWRKALRRASRDGRVGLAQGNLVSIRPAGEQLACEILFADARGRQTVLFDQVISATGFKSPLHHPLLAHLIKQYNLPTIGGFLALDDACCLPELSKPNSVFAVIGQASAWAVPCADSIGGMKIAARNFTRLILGPEKTSPHHTWQQTMRWTQMLVGKELV